MTSPKLIIFDCDGVLVDSEPLAATAFVRAYGRHGLTITPDVVAQCVGMKQADIFEKIHVLTGHDFPREHEGDLWTETRSLFTEHLRPTDGIAAFLGALAPARCVASSSQPERIEHSLAVTGLRSFFFGEAIFSSSMVRRGKPAPDLFLFAAERMGFPPHDCVVIEDSHYGIQGAIAAGMTAIGYTGGGHTDAGHAARLTTAGADAVFSDWSGIAGALEVRGFLPGR